MNRRWKVRFVELKEGEFLVESILDRRTWKGKNTNISLNGLIMTSQVTTRGSLKVGFQHIVWKNTTRSFLCGGVHCGVLCSVELNPVRLQSLMFTSRRFSALFALTTYSPMFTHSLRCASALFASRAFSHMYINWRKLRHSLHLERCFPSLQREAHPHSLQYRQYSNWNDIFHI